MSDLKICPDQAREIILDWLIPATEDGSVDTMYQLFCEELAPYAVQIARRVAQRTLRIGDPEAELRTRLREDLYRTVAALEAVCVKPEITARALIEAQIALKNWIRFLDASNRPTSPETAVPPAWDAMLARGDTP